MHKIFLFLLSFIISSQGFTQTNPIIDAFPKGTILHGNIPYNNDALSRHMLDIYLPENTKGKIPLVIFIHGGAWLSLAGVPNELHIVKDAPHYSVMFDTDEVRNKVMLLLNKQLKMIFV